MGSICVKKEESYPEQEGEDVKIVCQTITKNSSQSFCSSHIAERIDQFPQIKDSEKLKLADFQLIKMLGKSQQGKTLLVMKNENLYAMKIMKKKDLHYDNKKLYTKQERIILESIRSPFIIKLQYAFQSRDRLFLVTEFCQGGQLLFHLKKKHRFDEETTCFYAAEILLALESLHKNKVIYRDLKPENILIYDDGHIKMTNFGVSKIQRQERSYSIVGTPEYIAPEILLGQGYDNDCDLWSFGALIYEMLSGSPPFLQKNGQEMIQQRLEKLVEMKEYFSDKAVSLLQGLLANDPRYRLSLEEIKQHQFFEFIDWDRLEKKQIRPPFIPNLKDQQDLKYFDELQKNESLSESPISEICYDTYEKFTYQDEL